MENQTEDVTCTVQQRSLAHFRTTDSEVLADSPLDDGDISGLLYALANSLHKLHTALSRLDRTVENVFLEKLSRKE